MKIDLQHVMQNRGIHTGRLLNLELLSRASTRISKTSRVRRCINRSLLNQAVSSKKLKPSFFTSRINLLLKIVMSISILAKRLKVSITQSKSWPCLEVNGCPPDAISSPTTFCLMAEKTKGGSFVPHVEISSCRSKYPQSSRVRPLPSHREMNAGLFNDFSFMQLSKLTLLCR